MTQNNNKFQICGKSISPGQTRDVHLRLSETYSGEPVSVFVRIIRAKKPGPIIFLTGAIHGDELNGMGVIRHIMLRKLKLIKGTLICIPLVNVFGFENHSRYLPDRRDLNRAFPGNKNGNLSKRLAHTIFSEVISKCDYGIDLHAAAVRRTNFPQIRADLSNPILKEMAYAFGSELIINKKGHYNSLRAAATRAGCPTLLYEAGEVFKFEPGALSLGIRGVMNVLRHWGMLKGDIKRPIYQTSVQKTTWIRSNQGGMLLFHVRPGDIVKKGDKIATCEKLFSPKTSAIMTTVRGIVLGMTTLPAVKPGDPVCHIAVPDTALDVITEKVSRSPKTLHRRVQEQLSTNIRFVEAE